MSRLVKSFTDWSQIFHYFLYSNTNLTALFLWNIFTLISLHVRVMRPLNLWAPHGGPSLPAIVYSLFIVHEPAFLFRISSHSPNYERSNLRFLARDSIWRMLSSVRPSHGWISQKRLKLGLCCLHHTVAHICSFCGVSFIQKFEGVSRAGEGERQTRVRC